MRKFLKKAAIIIVLVVAISIAWIFGGRQISLFIDRFWTIETATLPVTSIVYEGSGTDGVFVINDLHLGLSPADQRTLAPNVGTTKDGELALSLGGKIFAFGKLRSEAEPLSAERSTADEATISIRHSALAWVEPFNFNFMTGHSPSWNRHLYNHLVWKKQNGTKLEMLWRYEQPYFPGDGWTNAVMYREGSTGLIRVDIQSPN